MLAFKDELMFWISSSDLGTGSCGHFQEDARLLGSPNSSVYQRHNDSYDIKVGRGDKSCTQGLVVGNYTNELLLLYCTTKKTVSSLKPFPLGL